MFCNLLNLQKSQKCHLINGWLLVIRHSNISEYIMEAIEHKTSHNDKKPDSDASAVVVDALPYIDLGYDEPGVREAALALVEEETRRYRPTKNYLEQVSLAVV